MLIVQTDILASTHKQHEPVFNDAITGLLLIESPSIDSQLLILYEPSIVK